MPNLTEMNDTSLNNEGDAKLIDVFFAFDEEAKPLEVKLAYPWRPFSEFDGEAKPSENELTLDL